MLGCNAPWRSAFSSSTHFSNLFIGATLLPLTALSGVVSTVHLQPLTWCPNNNHHMKIPDCDAQGTWLPHYPGSPPEAPLADLIGRI
jgi:hypothetical protein